MMRVVGIGFFLQMLWSGEAQSSRFDNEQALETALCGFIRDTTIRYTSLDSLDPASLRAP
jgi:hypothetical protein